MRIWSVVSQKGGSGKTTLLLHVSVLALHKGLSVSVLDLDPQRSAEQWSELREELLDTDEPAVVHGTPADLDGMLEAAADTETDLVLIDTPPAVDKSLVFAAAAAHLVIVPTRLGVLDQFSLRETLDYLKRISAIGKTMVVLNGAASDRKGRADIERIAREFGAAVSAGILRDQADFVSSLGAGKGITESAPKSRGTKTSKASEAAKAAEAIEEIYRELDAFDRKLARSKGRVAV